MKTIYIMRHAKPDKNNYTKSKSEIEKNKSISLSEEGIISATNHLKQFKNIKNIYCSDYKRSYQTGWCSNKKIIIEPNLGERISGIVDEKIAPLEYFYKQVKDENYSFKQGETRKQIENRMYQALQKIIENNDSAIIITHGTALTFLLMKLCQIEFPDKTQKIRKITFNNKLIFNDKFDYLETFKLTFKNNKLIDIKHIQTKNQD